MPRNKPQSEQEYRLSVLSYERRDRKCPVCGNLGLIYVCHGFGLNWPETTKIQDRCKRCAIQDAGGEGHVWVKTTYRGLRDTWCSGRRPVASEERLAALQIARAKRAGKTSSENAISTE